MRTVQGFFFIFIECLNPYSNLWVIRWNKREEINDLGETVTKWEEEVFDHKPILEEIKAVMICQQ